MVKSFTDYWLVRLLIDKMTLSSYSLIKVSTCLVAATCWYAVFLLRQSIERSQKSPNQNVDKCPDVHAVSLSEVWSRLRRL